MKNYTTASASLTINYTMPISTKEKIQNCKEPKAEKLDLKGNRDERLASIPDAVFELTHLKELNLQNNNLTTIPEKLKY
uniref:hypothetical protein n=1 Tax=Candidatus Albibeggiatoa sp. nov. BB20 TaxID=3162723 RepID=UPI00336596BE